MAVGLGAIRLPPSPMDGEGDRSAPSGRLDPLEVDISGDIAEVDPETATKIELPDGGVTINIGRPRKKRIKNDFGDNLAEDMSDGELGEISQDLLERIGDDDMSRKEWLETRKRGIELMGLKIESMRSNGADGSAPLEGQSQVRATLLTEAVIRFGANAFAELVPTDGPAKVTEDTSGAYPDLDDLASALESDLNHYLMVIDKPWVPDTDAMLLRTGLDGCVFKKVYHDPILRRPISRAVYGEDIIVNNSANSIYDAGRLTHRTFMRPSMMKRMQLIGQWRDISLGDPGYPTMTAPEEASQQIAGMRRRDSWQDMDRDHEFYESYCEIDLPEFALDGLEGVALPYKVTIHKESQQIVEVRRNWREDDDMALPKTWFVQYPFIRGFGFYAIGLSHLLGNLTNGITATWREFVDAGMYANFPGLLVGKGAGRQNNNIFRVPPGGAAEVETGGNKIQDVVMPLPYKSPDAVFVGFIQQLEATGQRLGGTADLMVGEGRQDAPVGTTLALIEQAIKPLMATHKRLCAAQSDELQLLIERFREDPQSFIRASKEAKPKLKANSRMPSRIDWDDEVFLQAINENKIVTRADPNTASHVQRMLRNAALYQIAKDEPPAFNVKRIRQVCIRGIGFGDPDQFLNQNPSPAPADPKAEAERVSAQADLIDAQANAAKAQHDMQWGGTDAASAAADRQTKLDVAQLDLQKQKLLSDSQDRQADVKAKTALAQTHHDNLSDAQSQARDHAHEAGMAKQDLMHQALIGQQQQAHEQQMGHFQAANDRGLQQEQQQHDQMQTQQTQLHEQNQQATDQAHQAQLETKKQDTQAKLATTAQKSAQKIAKTKATKPAGQQKPKKP